MKQQVNSYRLAAVLVIILAIVYFYLNLFWPDKIPKSLRIGMLRQPFTLLVIGTDMTFNAETNQPMPDINGRADSIVLLQIDPIKARLNILSIPRDSYVSIPGYGKHKINAANVFGGTSLMQETVANLLNQKIDYYLVLKPAVVTNMVDSVGGIYIDVEKDMRYVDRAQGLDINLKKGYQKLSGKEALDYIRFRHDIYGDIARISRQQTFFKALRQAISRPSNIIKAPFVIKVGLKEIKTNLSLPTTFRLLNWARTISTKNIYADTISGEAVNISGAGSIWQIDEAYLNRQLKELFKQ